MKLIGNRGVRGNSVEYRADIATIEYVVLSSWHIYIDSADLGLRKKMIEGHDRTINAIKETNKKIVFVIDTPSLNKVPEICVESSVALRNVFKKIPSSCNETTEDDFVLRTEYKKAVASLRSAHPTVIFYDPFNLFCAEGKCNVFEGSKLLYADEHHLSVHESQHVVNGLLMLKKLESLGK
jgi:hypothetical protein